MMLGRAKQAHHGIEDVEIKDLDAEAARRYQNFLDQMRGWRVVLMSLAATVLLVGGVGVLSVMLISLLRPPLRDRPAQGDGRLRPRDPRPVPPRGVRARRARRPARHRLGRPSLCQALSASFPYGLVVNPVGLVIAWVAALALALVFGLYPAIRASRLSPMEAMR